jgi:hypothetical protein
LGEGGLLYAVCYLWGTVYSEKTSIIMGQKDFESRIRIKDFSIVENVMVYACQDKAGELLGEQ